MLAAVLPVAWDRLESFSGSTSLEPRLVVGLGMGLAAAFMALPGALLAILLVVAVHAAGARRSVGTRSALLAVGAALALSFPVVLEALRSPTSLLGSTVAPSSVAAMLRFASGPGPGTGWTAFFLPIAALMASTFVGDERRGPMMRALAAVLVAVVLAWAVGAGVVVVLLRRARPRLVGAHVLAGLGGVVGSTAAVYAATGKRDLFFLYSGHLGEQSGNVAPAEVAHTPTFSLAFVPEKLAGLGRTEVSAGSGGMPGLQTTQAKAQYEDASGKRIELEIDGADPADQATKMAEELLANQLIEDFHVEVPG